MTRFRILSPLILAVVCLITYGGVFRHGFVHWDDNLHITENPGLNPPAWSSLVRFWREPYEDLYIPLSYTLFTAEAVLADAIVPRGDGAPPHPLVFKLTSLFLHWACAVLVWLLLQRWTGRWIPSLIGAAFFAVHPVQVESVAWTSEQRGLLSALLGLAALWLRVPLAACPPVGERDPACTGGQAASSTPRVAPDVRSTGFPPVHIWAGWKPALRSTRWREPAALLLFAAGLLAKPTLVVVAPIVLAIDLLEGGRDWRRAVVRSLPWWGLAGAMTLLTQRVQPAGALPFEVNFVQRLQIACDALAVHVRHWLWPWPLGIDYGRTPEVALHSSLWWFGAIGLIAAGAIAFRAAPRIRLAIALTVLGLLPTLGLQPFAFQTISTVADRYAYLALLGPALGLALLVSGRALAPGSDQGRSPAMRGFGGLRPDQNRGLAPARSVLAVAVLVSLAIVSHRQVAVWRSDDALFRHALSVNPRSHIAWNNLGQNLVRRGDRVGAEAAFRRAVDIAPNTAHALYNLGVQAERAGDENKAGEFFERAAVQPQARAEMLIAWARWLARHDRQTEALEWYAKVVGTDARPAEAVSEFAMLLHETGSTPQAKTLLESAMAKDAHAWSPRVALGHLLLSEGRTDDAAQLYEAALAIREDLPEPLLNLGLLASRQGDWKSAEDLLARARSAALQRTNPEVAATATKELSAVLQASGLAILEAGSARPAVEKFQQACELDPTSAAAHFHLGRAHLAAGDAAAARKSLTLALGLVPPDSEAAHDIRAVLKRAGTEG